MSNNTDLVDVKLVVRTTSGKEYISDVYPKCDAKQLSDLRLTISRLFDNTHSSMIIRVLENDLLLKGSCIESVLISTKTC
jgi:hypothetical protein